MNSAVNAVTGESLEVADGKIRVKIAPFGFVIVKACR